MGVETRAEHEVREVVWQIAARRSTYARLNKRSILYKVKRRSSTARLRHKPRLSICFG